MSELRKLLRDLIRAVSEKDFNQFVDGKSDFTKITEIATQIIKLSENELKSEVFVVFGMEIDATSIIRGIFDNQIDAEKCRDEQQRKDEYGFYLVVRKYQTNKTLGDYDYEEIEK